MGAAQKNITLGTAGHIDHGKTALIKCLTGCDTDHLKAEKERGMSIDLGFAPCTVSELEVGIVDVPGHENFIKTMVAGASGIDGVIFVIAADDGVMPQTREHLDILTLLGVEYGIVALTKIDCVSHERIQSVTGEVRDFLVGTFLESAPILPLSGITGEGFDSFYESLKELVNTIEPKDSDGVFRLPVDRAFSVKGYGTVVTGIPVTGAIKAGDEVTLFPHEVEGRIKAIQVYKRNSDTAMVGQCAALNVPQWDYKSIDRGCVVTLGEYFSPQQWYLCKLRILANTKSPLKSGADVKFHTGTSEVVATVYILDGNSVAAGRECLMQVRLKTPDGIIAAPGDHFILRSLSPVQTIGGGMIVEALSEKQKRNQPGVVRDAQERAQAVLDKKDFVEYCVKTAKAFAVTENEVSIRTKVLQTKLNTILDELIGQNKIIKLDSKLFIHSDIYGNVREKLLKVIGGFHDEKPESPGLSVEKLCSVSGLRKDVFDGLINRLISEGEIVERKHCLALPEHQEQFSNEEQGLLNDIEFLFKERLFNPPGFEEIDENVSADTEKVRKIIRVLIEQERLIRIDRELIFHCDAVEKARELLISFIKEQDGLESVKFKYLLKTTRKFAIPLLDYFDRIGVTRRVGYTRYLRNPVD